MSCSRSLIRGVHSSKLRAKSSELGISFFIADICFFGIERLKKPDTRAVKPERRIQSGCEAERYPRLGSGGSPG